MKHYHNFMFMLMASAWLFARSVVYAGTGYGASVIIPSLAPAEIGALFLDKQGLLWIGTTDGLLSYDGYTLREYLTDKNALNLVQSSHVISLAESGCQLWIGTYDGLLRMDRRTGHLRRYDLPRKSQQIIYTLFAAKDGTIYVGTDDGLSVYNATSDSFSHYNDRNTVATYADGRRDSTWGYSVKSIVELPDGDLLLGTWNSGLLRFDPKKRAFHAFNRLNGMNSAYTVCTDRQGRVWIGTWEDGVQRLDHADDYALSTLCTVAPKSEDFGAVHALKANPDGRSVWACTDGGLRLIDDKGTTDLSQMDGHQLNAARRLTSSSCGLFLVATRSGNILSVKPRLMDFRYFADDRLNSIYSIYTEDGRHVLLGNGTHGVAQLDMATHTVLCNGQIPGLSVLKEYGPGSCVRDMVRLTNGDLWIAAGEQNVFVSHPDGTSVVLGRHDLPCLVDNVSQLCEARDGMLWIGMRMGVSVLRPDGTCEHIDARQGNLDMTGYWLVNHIMQETEGNIWISSKNDGMVCVAQGNYKHYPVPTNVTAVFEDSRRRIWAVSPTNGLLLYHPQTDVFEPVSGLSQLPFRKICAINEDFYGSLWLATDGGLMRLTLDDKGYVSTFVVFTAEDGLPQTSFMPNATFRHGNQLFFGTTGGVVCFTPEAPENIGASPSGYPLVITDLLVDGTSFSELDSVRAVRISTVRPAHTRDIRIPSTVRKFAVEFALLRYSNANAVQYAYWLEGYDDDWQPLPAHVHCVTFDRLPSGNYRLHLRATDGEGRWTELPYTINLHILPPWYRTWWACLTYLLVSVLLGWFVYDYLRMQRETKASRRFTAMMRSMMPTEPETGTQSAIISSYLKVPTSESHPVTGTPGLSRDAEFLKRANSLVLNHLSDADYNRERLAEDLGMGLTSLYDRLRGITGLSIQVYIQSLRLNAACDILRADPGIRISELAYRVGFNTPKYFSQCFKKMFGMLPGEYARQQGRTSP